MASDLPAAPAVPTAATPIDERGASYRWVALALCFLGFMVAYMPRLGLAPLAPFLKDDLHLTKAQVGLLSSATTAGYAIFLIPAGLFCDRWGVRWTLVAGQIVGGLFLVGMMFVHGLNAALIVMFGVGLGLGIISPSTTKGIVDWFSQRERATALGIKQMSLNAAGLVSAAALPAVALRSGWRVGFAGLGAVAIASGVLSMGAYREVVPGLAGAPGGGAPTAATPWVSRLSALASRDVLLLFAAAAFYYTAEMGVLTYFVLYLKGQLLVPVVAAGFLLGAVDVGGLFGKPLAGFVSDRFFHGKRKGALVGILGGTTLFAAVFALLPAGTPQWLILVCSVAFGLVAMAFGGVYYAMLSEFVGREHAATAIGAASVVMMLCAMVGIPLFGHISDVTGSWTWSWIYLTSLSAVSTVAACFVREERKRLLG
jgi:ACS family hexuronate transporter-like MFS transporter